MIAIPRIVGMETRQLALAAFQLQDPQAKVQAVQALWAQAPGLALDVHAVFQAPDGPGRPARPVLVAPKDVPHRTPFTPQGHAALMHSIVHIEFNAINLALDCVWRFAGLPEAFYRDWLRVAYEESQHFSMLQQHLREAGYDYGDFTAHDGLWELCHATRHDLAARMALVPRTLEARGLDATPLIQARLRKVGTPQAAQAIALLDVILAEEEGHVAAGNRWYHWACARDGLPAASYAAQAAVEHRSPRPKPPYNINARRRAGFSEEELAALPGNT